MYIRFLNLQLGWLLPARLFNAGLASCTSEVNHNLLLLFIRINDKSILNS